jgi:N-methylhydantoinase A
VHAVERGVDVARLPLFAFGGAGPTHACGVARKLDIQTVIVPPGAGVGSAIGLLAAPLAFDFVRSAVSGLEDLDWAVVEQLVGEMEREGERLLVHAGVLPNEVSKAYAVDMRLVGQAHEVTVPLADRAPRQDDGERLQEAFGETYRTMFGRPPPPVSLEVVSWRVRLEGPAPEFPVRATSAGQHVGNRGDCQKGVRPTYQGAAEGFVPTPVYDRYRMVAGMRLDGPAIVEERESTLLIPPGGHATVDEWDNIVVELR